MPRPRTNVLQIAVALDYSGRRHIRLNGELNADTAPRLVACLDEALHDEADTIVVDLRGLDAIDPASVRVLLVAHLRAADDQRRLILIPANDWVQQIIDRVHAPFSYGGPNCD